MSVIDEYRRQYSLRNWTGLYEALPDLDGATVLDLGCGLGYQSRDLAQRGASVIGVDSNAELIAEAAAQEVANCRFVVGDIIDLSSLDVGKVDGIWSSFSAAYCTNLEPVLESWLGQLQPGGWLALTEVSALFDHQPMEKRFAEKLPQLYRQRLEEGRYDFMAGAKLEATAERLGLRVIEHSLVEDGELSADGPLSAPAMESWERRLERLSGLATFFDADFEAFREALLRSLAHEDHTSGCRVHFVLATTPTAN